MGQQLTVKERMKIERTPMRNRKPEVRRTDFKEVPIGYSLEEAQREASRCIDCKRPLCIQGCPVGIKIPAFIKQVEAGDIKQAAKVLMETNQLPAICGRVCPQDLQCEAKCIMGKRGKPVAIGNLERFVADYARQNSLLPALDVAPKKNQKVAIVGSGPAGLTAAAELQKWGYDVTIFEALHKPGGVLMYGIPCFRLPIETIENELSGLIEMGVKIECDTLIGRTITVEELFQLRGFDAVLIGTGAGLPKMLNIPGGNLKGIFSANEFLTRVNLMGANDFPHNITPVKIGKNVVIIGAGNTAMDAARTSIRFNPESVKLVYRRSREEAPARTEEILHAEEEGIDFHFLNNPVRFIGDEHYNLKQIELVKMKLGEPDADGRRKPIPIEGSNYLIDADMVVMALGFGVNPLIAATTSGLKTTKWGTLEVDENGMTSHKGLFAAGDIITGGSTVIMAMGQAKTAAQGIDRYLKSIR